MSVGGQFAEFAQSERSASDTRSVPDDMVFVWMELIHPPTRYFAFNVPIDDTTDKEHQHDDNDKNLIGQN